MTAFAAPAPPEPVRTSRGIRPDVLMRRAILTVVMSGVVIAFLSPLAYSALTSLKTESQISDPSAPILPSDPRTFDYQGETLDVYFVPMTDGSTRELALVKKGRTQSDFIDPANPAAGTITWGGAPRPRGAEAMVFQRPVMLRRGALANVEYALAVNGVGGSERRRRAREALERAGLASLAQRPARVLSGGEQQRLALARAWALRPRILYLDEPTASLDPTAAAEIEREIGAIHAAGTRIVMTTHHLGLARRIADEILFLHDGRLVEQTPAERFFDAPRSEEARQFLEGELPWSTA